MDDISVAGEPVKVKKGIRKFPKMELEKKMKQIKQNEVYGSTVKTSKEKEEQKSEQVKAGSIQKTSKYKY